MRRPAGGGGYPRVFTVSTPAPGLVEIFFLDTSPLVHSYRDQCPQPEIAENVASQDAGAQLALARPQPRCVDRGVEDRRGSPHDPLGRQRAWRHGRDGRAGPADPAESTASPSIFNGHEHDLQHIRRDGLDYHLLGRRVRRCDRRGRSTGTRFALARSGFAVIRLDATTLDLAFHDFAGSTGLSRTTDPRAA